MALVLLIAGIYLAWIEPTKGSGKAFVYARNIFGVVFFVLALVYAAAGIQGYLDEEIAAKLQVISGQAERSPRPGSLAAVFGEESWPRPRSTASRSSSIS